jgi:hypothetical protein
VFQTNKPDVAIPPDRSRWGQEPANSHSPGRYTLLNTLQLRAETFIRGSHSGLKVDRTIDLAASRTLGEEIAAGFYIAFTGNTAEFHLLPVPLKSTREDLQTVQKRLLQCMNECELVKGVTPSHSALRAVILILQGLPEISREDSRMLKQFRKEAVELDLKNPTDTNWQRSFKLRIGQESFDISVKLKPVSYSAYAAAAIFGRSIIPEEQRDNKYSFEMTMWRSPQKVDSVVWSICEL